METIACWSRTCLGSSLRLLGGTLTGGYHATHYTPSAWRMQGAGPDPLSIAFCLLFGSRDRKFELTVSRRSAAPRSVTRLFSAMESL
jgi:hypothetical protein